MTNKSNADVAREAARNILDGVGGGHWHGRVYTAASDKVESALNTAQAQLAEKVLAAIMGAELSRASEKRVRDLFTQMGIEIES